jgi:GNAT superfamily N-acetyltransferase
MNITINTTNAFSGDSKGISLKEAKPYRRSNEMECVIENYPYGRDDENKNKKIIRLAKRYKFYWKIIENIITGGGWCLDRKSFHIATARIKNKIIGFIIYSSPNIRGRYFTTSSVDYWLVDEEFRGYGIGKQLFDVYLEAHKKYGGFNRWVNFKRGDEELEKLYTKMGYKEIEIYSGFTQDTKKMDREERQCKEHHKWWFIERERVSLKYGCWIYSCEDTKYNKYKGWAVYNFLTGKEEPEFDKWDEDVVSYKWFEKYATVMSEIKKE